VSAQGGGGAPTAGCVSIPADQLVRIMRWLDPAKHPRILIGVS
jgi:L,D-peptidoglycan transpeptidase YkuD (ErfK/YbiS/YcfS/YnhG family)